MGEWMKGFKFGDMTAWDVKRKQNAKFGRRLRELREKEGLGYSQLGMMVYRTGTSVQSWEKGLHGMDPLVSAVLAHFFKVPHSHLCDPSILDETQPVWKEMIENAPDSDRTLH